MNSRVRVTLLATAVPVAMVLIALLALSATLVAAAPRSQGPGADLQITKTADDYEPYAGESVEFELEVVNNGPLTATNVVLQDFLPAGVTVEGVLPSTGSCTTGTPGDPLAPLTCNLGEMITDTTSTVQVTVRIDPDYVDAELPWDYRELENDALVSSETYDPDNGNNRAHVILDVYTLSELAIQKWGFPEEVIAGEEAEYEIRIRNFGPSTVDMLHFVDLLPDGVTYLGYWIEQGTGTCTYHESLPWAWWEEYRGVHCYLDEIRPNGISMVHLQVLVNADLGPDPGFYDLCNIIPDDDPRYSSNDYDEDMPHDEWGMPGWFADSDIEIPWELSYIENEGEYFGWCPYPLDASFYADLSIEKTSEPPKILPGEQKVYHIEVTNNGPSDALNVMVLDTLPMELRYQIDTDNCDVFPGPPDQLTCDLGTIPAGESSQFDIHALVEPPYQVTQTVEITNTAEVWDIRGSYDPDETNNSDWTKNLILPPNAADLAIQKWWEEAPPEWFVSQPYTTTDCYVGGNVRAGCPLIYGLLITNTGPSLAQNVVVEDFLPAGVAVDNVGAPGSCTTGIPGDPSAPLTCNLGNIAPGEDRSMQIVVVTDSDLAWGRLENDARVSSDIFDPDNGNNRAHVLTWVEPFSYLYLDKNKSGPATIMAGEQIEYWINLNNYGPSTAHDVYLEDQLPGGVSPVSIDVMIGDGSCAPDSTLCSLGDVAPYEWHSVRVRGYVESWLEGGTVITNTASAWANSPWEFWAITNTVTTTVQAATDLSIQKTSEPMKVYPGEQKLYHIEVTNNGPADAPNVIVTDTLPSAVDYEIDNVNCDLFSEDPDVLECHLGTIPAGQTAAFDISALVFADAPAVEITNTAVVSMPYDTNPDNNTAWAANLVLEPVLADLELQKTASTLSPYAGTDIQFTLLVTNHGPVAAENVVLEDMLPEGLTVQSVNPGPGSCTTGTPGSEPLRCNLGTLAVDASATVIVSVHIDPGYMGTLENDAVVSSDIYDLNNSNNRDFVIVNVNTSSSVFLKKGCGWEEEVLAGEQIQYDILVRNNGPSTVHNFELWDLLPDDVTYLSYEILPGGGQCFYTPHLPPMHGGDGPGLHCYLGDVAPTDTRIVYITVRIDPDAPAGELTNEVTDWEAESNFSLQGPPSNRECSNIVVNRADLSIRKTADPYTVYAGEEMRYDVSVTNNGPSVAYNVVVTDALPISVTYEIDTDDCLQVGETNTYTCTLGDIPPGEARDFAIFVRVNPDTLGMINNRVDVLSDTEDPNPNNDWDTEANLVLGKADLRVVKYGKPDGVVEAGDELVYTVIVDNLGPGYAHEVVLYDLFRSSDWAYYLDDVRSDLDAECWDDRTSRETTITCHLSSPLEPMSPDSSGRWVLKFYFEVFEEQSVNNVADVVGADFDPDLSNNHAITEHEITAVADLDLEKEAWGDVLVGCEGDTEQWENEVAAGGMLEYRLEVYNEGPSEAENVVVEDWGLSPFLDIVDVQCEKDDSWRECSCNLSGLGELGDTNRHLVCYLGEIDEDDEDVIIITARIPSDVPEGTRLVNDARVYSDVFDDDNGDNLASNWTYVSRWADLEVEKTQDPEVVLPGQDITYSIKVTNHGLSDVEGVIISDTLPVEVLNPTWTCCASDGQCDVPCEPPVCPRGECPWPDIGLFAQADIPADEWVIYTIEGTMGVWPCPLPITNTVELIPPQSVVHLDMDIDPCDENNVDEVVNVVPFCNYDPLILKQYPGPDSPP